MYKFEKINNGSWYIQAGNCEKATREDLLMEIIFELNLEYEEVMGDTEESSKALEIIDNIFSAEMNETLIYFNRGRILKITKIDISQEEWDRLEC